MTNAKPTAADYLEKADKNLKWASTLHTEMREHGTARNTNEVERCFCSILALVATVHESLGAAAKKAGRKDWREGLEADRERDPLLRYFWLARNSEVHDALTKWEPTLDHFQLETVDPAKVALISGEVRGQRNRRAEAHRVFLYIFEATTDEEIVDRVVAGHFPSPERLASAGVKLKVSLQCFALNQFRFRLNGSTIVADPPTKHFDNTFPPSTDICTMLALQFYRQRAAELRHLMGV